MAPGKKKEEKTQKKTPVKTSSQWRSRASLCLAASGELRGRCGLRCCVAARGCMGSTLIECLLTDNPGSTKSPASTKSTPRRASTAPRASDAVGPRLCITTAPTPLTAHAHHSPCPESRPHRVSVWHDPLEAGNTKLLIPVVSRPWQSLSTCLTRLNGAPMPLAVSSRAQIGPLQRFCRQSRESRVLLVAFVPTGKSSLSPVWLLPKPRIFLCLCFKRPLRCPD